MLLKGAAVTACRKETERRLRIHGGGDDSLGMPHANPRIIFRVDQQDGKADVLDRLFRLDG